MKIRSGFVSNSSSSSFVAVGFEFSDRFKKKDIANLLELSCATKTGEYSWEDCFYDDFYNELKSKYDVEFFNDVDSGAASSKAFIGKVIAETNSYEPYFNRVAFDIASFSDKLSIIAEKLNLNEEEKKTIVLAGWRAC